MATDTTIATSAKARSDGDDRCQRLVEALRLVRGERRDQEVADVVLAQAGRELRVGLLERRAMRSPTSTAPASPPAVRMEK